MNEITILENETFENFEESRSVILTMEQIIKEIEEYIASGMYQYEGIGLTKEQFETIVDTYKNYKNIDDTLNEQIKYIKIVEKVKKVLESKLKLSKHFNLLSENEDIEKGAVTAYQDVYNFISELEHDEPREDSTN